MSAFTVTPGDVFANAGALWTQFWPLIAVGLGLIVVGPIIAIVKNSLRVSGRRA